MSEFIEVMRAEAVKLGLTCIDSPDGSEVVIFNIATIAQVGGCAQFKSNGDVWAAWDERKWGLVRQDEALNVLKILAKPIK